MNTEKPEALIAVARKLSEALKRINRPDAFHNELQDTIDGLSDALEAAGQREAALRGLIRHAELLINKAFGWAENIEVIDDDKNCWGALLSILRDLEAALATPQDKAEPDMRKHVESFALHAGWDKSDGEGAFEFVQRMSYHQGWQDGRREALGDVHRDSPEVTPPKQAAEAVDARDAARYRWLRDEEIPQRDHYVTDGERGPIEGRRLDKAIDAAIAAEKGAP